MSVMYSGEACICRRQWCVWLRTRSVRGKFWFQYNPNKCKYTSNWHVTLIKKYWNKRIQIDIPCHPKAVSYLECVLYCQDWRRWFIFVWHKDYIYHSFFCSMQCCGIYSYGRKLTSELTSLNEAFAAGLRALTYYWTLNGVWFDHYMNGCHKYFAAGQMARF